MITRIFRPAALAMLMTMTALVSPALAQTALRASLNADIRSTDPGINRDANSDMVVFHILEGLVAYSNDTDVVPMLAADVQVSDDGLTYTFPLREGVTFHNGAALTAEDVVFAWKRYLDPALAWRCLPEFTGGVANVIDIAAHDERTVTITLEKPSALFLASMARLDCGQSGIWHRDSLNADGSWNAPVGTGPYSLTEWRQGQFIDLTKFAEYAALPGDADGLAGNKGEGPDTIRLVLIPDGAAARAALQSGDIDLIPDIDSEQDADDLARKDGLNVARAPTLSTSGILFQTENPVLADARVRRAIAMSIDNAQLVKAVGGQAVNYNASPIPEISGFYGDAQRQGYPYDPEAAKALLAEAGYAGEEIVILTNQRYKSMYDTAVLSQAMLEANGINVRFEVMDWATQLDRYADGNYMAQAFSYSARYDASLSFEMFMGSKAEQARKIWDNPEAQALLDQSMQTLDLAARQALFDQLHKMMIEDAPAIWQYNGQALAAYGPNVSSFEPWGTSAPRLWTARMK